MPKTDKWRRVTACDEIKTLFSWVLVCPGKVSSQRVENERSGRFGCSVVKVRVLVSKMSV